MKKILVLGGTGAMGVYLTPELLDMGYAVDVVSLDNIDSDNPNLRYITANALDNGVLAELLKNEYDGIIDFLFMMTRRTALRRGAICCSKTHRIIFFFPHTVFMRELIR